MDSKEEARDRLVKSALQKLAFTAPELISEKVEQYVRAAFAQGFEWGKREGAK